MSAIAEKLRELRQRRGWTLRQAAVYSGLSIATISRVERGQRHPDAPTLQRLARAYGADEAELLHLAGYLSGAVAPTGQGSAVDVLDQLLAAMGLPAQRREWWIAGILAESAAFGSPRSQAPRKLYSRAQQHAVVATL